MMGEPIDIVKRSLRRREDEGGLDVGWGKLPPQAKELEEAVLAAIMLEKDAFSIVGAILKSPECFYVDAHQRIYRAMIELFAANNPIDLLTITEQLRKLGDLDNAGGPFYVAQLSNKIGSAANVEYHARVVKEKHIQRCLITASSEVIKEAYEDTSDPIEATEKAIVFLGSILDDCRRNPDRSMAELVKEFDDDLLNESDAMGYDTGLENLNKKILGYNKTHLIIIAGRPGEGKTTLMLQGARAAARKGIPVGIISMEMKEKELMQKLYAMEAGIDIRSLRTKKLTSAERERYERAKKFVATWQLHIYARGGVSIQEAKAVMVGWKVKYGIQEAFLDYIQLATFEVMNGHYKNREQEISSITRGLKELAMDLDIPVIALSAMSREIESRQKSERRPLLSDLRESGAIEQDANEVIFVFRPEIHGIDKFKDGTSTEGFTEIIVSKSRMDATGVLRNRFDGQHSMFLDDDGSHYNEDGDGIKIYPNESRDNTEKKESDGYDDLPF